jgi:hypothetical protein
MGAKPRYVVAALAAAIGLAVAGSPTAAGQPSQETCTSLNTSSTKCQSPGNAEINDSLTRAYVSPQWSSFGQQSGGPYGGSLGGGSR